MDSGYSGESGEKWSDSDSVLKVEPLGLLSIREGVNEREMSFWSEPELQEMQSGVCRTLDEEDCGRKIRSLVLDRLSLRRSKW